MNDYISREAAETAFCNYMGATSGRVALMAEQIFSPIPAADVVEVVRCRECKYYRQPGWCENPNTLTIGNTSQDWFCAVGKRKESADNG